MLSLACLLDAPHGCDHLPSSQCPFFQGEAIFANAMRKIVDWWREPAKRFKKEAHRALAASMVPIGRDAIGVSKVLRDAIEKKWEHDSQQVMKRLESAFKEALDESAPFGTANHYLYDKYVEQQVMPDDMVEGVIEALLPIEAKDLDQSKSYDDWFDTNGNTIRAKLLGMREKTATQDRQKALHEHVAKRVLGAVRAAWSVEKKTVRPRMLRSWQCLPLNAAPSTRAPTMPTPLVCVSSRAGD